MSEHTEVSKVPSVAFDVGRNERAIVKPCEHGIEVFVRGKCLVRIDLHHLLGIDGDQYPKFPQVVLYTGDDGQDPIGHVRWFEGRVNVSLDSGYEWDQSHDGVYLELDGNTE